MGADHEPELSAQAIVSLFVDPRLLDELLEDLKGSALLQLPWLVFGQDAALMKALQLQWADSLCLTLVLVPDPAVLDEDLVTTVLEAEKICAEDCAWVVSSIGSSARPGSGKVFDVEELSVAALASSLAALRWDVR
jgi:hypothetical protein